MADPTEATCRSMVEEINGSPETREKLEAHYGEHDVFDTKQLSADFEVLGFMTPFVVVKRRSDGVKGSFMFQHHPRFYFGWQPD